MGKFIPVEPEKWAEMVKAQAEVARLEHVVNYWKVEAETDNARWLRVLEENARLKAEVERLTEAWVDKKMQEDRDALLQQVERLTKAGDWLVEAVQTDDCWENWDKGIAKWNAAKNGGQP